MLNNKEEEISISKNILTIKNIKEVRTTNPVSNKNARPISNLCSDILQPITINAIKGIRKTASRVNNSEKIKFPEYNRKTPKKTGYKIATNRRGSCIK